MLSTHCPACKKAFHWTYDIPVKGECPNMDSKANYDLYSALNKIPSGFPLLQEKIFCATRKYSRVYDLPAFN